MSDSIAKYATLDQWIAHEALPCSLDAGESFEHAIDTVVAALGDTVELLGFGEPLHGGEEILIFRNRLFQHLVLAHGYSAITIESSFPMARVVNEYINGRGPRSYEKIQDTGIGYSMGKLEANRELVEWMREYNADPAHTTKLHFYGFDMPTSLTGMTGPRQVLTFALEYLTSIDPASGQVYRERIEQLLGEDFDWENPAMYADPSISPGLSANATALRIATEDLITELRLRQPEHRAQTDASHSAEALHYANIARQLLTYHAAHAGNAGLATGLAIRDLLMADNLLYTLASEQGRGKVLAFSHNSHLQHGKMILWPSWQQALGAEPFSWWPAGAHISRMLGEHYAVIGSGLGASEANGIGEPEPGTLEAKLTAAPGPLRLIATHLGQGLPAEELAALPVRSTSTKNLSYVPLNQHSMANYDWLVIFDRATYTRGGPPLPEQNEVGEEAPG